MKTRKIQVNRFRKHGAYDTPLYKRWISIRKRCNTKTATGYSGYGARDIKMCEQWNDFAVFRDWAIESGYKPELEIDRIDGTKGYGPDNCRWATRAQNAANRSVKPGRWKYRGISRNRSAKWIATVSNKRGGKGGQLYLGIFPTALQAALAYDKAIFAIHGAFARLNFPERYRARSIP